MEQVSPKKYDKRFNYSYAPGVFSTLELLKYKQNEVLRVFLCDKGKQKEGIEEIRAICRKSKIELVEAENLIIKLSGSDDCYAVGVFKKYLNNLTAEKNHIVLINPSDMGNVGTIIRTATAFGINNIALIKPAVDVFDPKVIRATAGAFFQVNIQYFDSFREYTEKFSNNCYLFMLNGDVELTTCEFKKPFSLVFGNEVFGIPEDLKKYGTAVFIKHEKNIESLNLSIAAGIAIHKAVGR